MKIFIAPTSLFLTLSLLINSFWLKVFFGAFANIFIIFFIIYNLEENLICIFPPAERFENPIEISNAIVPLY